MTLFKTFPHTLPFSTVTPSELSYLRIFTLRKSAIVVKSSAQMPTLACKFAFAHISLVPNPVTIFLHFPFVLSHELCIIKNFHYYTFYTSLSLKLHAFWFLPLQLPTLPKYIVRFTPYCGDMESSESALPEVHK